MAKRNLDHLKQHQFKPGQSGNPKGGSLMPPEVAKAKKLNANEVTVLISKMFRMTLDELKVMMSDPLSNNMELIVGKIMAEAIKHGDYSRVNALWDRSIGKVTDKIEHSMPKPTVYRFVDELGKPTNEVALIGHVANEE